MRESAPYAGRLVGLCAIYITTAKLGLQLDPVHGFATLVWPPTGIALAALLVFGKRLWPAIALGAFAVNFTTGASVLVASGIAAGNTLEAVVSAVLLDRVCRFDRSLGRVRDVLALALVAAVGCTFVSATIGVGGLWVGGILDDDAVLPALRAWWLGDALGDLVVTPVLLVWSAPPKIAMTRARWLEAIGLAIAIVAVALYIFDVVVPRSHPEDLRFTYLVYPVMIWAALRFRQHGATLGMLLVWVVSIVATTLGLGPFASSVLSDSLLSLQLFVGVVAASTLFLAAACTESEKAEHVARARELFLGVAGHELRTPLASLVLQVSSMRDALEHASDTVPREWITAALAVVERQVGRLAVLVENLLDASQIMAGRFKLVFEDVDLREVVREVTDRLKQQATKAGCELVIAADELARGSWDRVRIDQILTNLIANAIKFGAGKPIEIRLTAEPSTIRLEVRDHGAGIAPADHQRIFELFVQASTARSFGGLGLGLWITKQLVNAMAGTVAVTSEPGQGATFTVTLPRSPPRQINHDLILRTREGSHIRSH